MIILGISAFYHDSAAAITRDGEIVAAVQEERFTRKKHDSSFPVNAIRFCLEYSGYTIDDLDAVAFYDKPFLKFERILETYYDNTPKGLISFTKSMPVWIREKIFMRKVIHDKLKETGPYNRKQLKLLFPEHHVSHAASAFFASSFDEAGILTIDGVGEWATCTISRGKGNTIEILRELKFPDSVGLLYSAFTYYLGFRVNSGEYKLMGLAPYGNPGSGRTKDYIRKIKTSLVDIREDGSIRLNQTYFSYTTGLRMTHNRRWSELFGFERRLPEGKIEQEHCDLAYAIQAVTEEIVMALARETRKLSGTGKLCLAGGVALNCVANGRLLKEGIVSDIYIQPAAGDAGGAVGAALAVHYIYFGKERRNGAGELMKYGFLGPVYTDEEIAIFLRRAGAEYIYLDDDELFTATAKYLYNGMVVGWFQGRMEFGPRALGNRSILGDATNPDMQKKMNLKIKFRESFRPFAPAVLEEDSKDYFELNTGSPYMLLVGDVIRDRRKEIPGNYFELGYQERLATPRADIQSVTHVDFSARIQSVSRESNERFYRLIQAYKKLSGYGVIINTSFNIRGEPIVNTPEDAYRCFMNTEMDVLVMGNYLCTKNEKKTGKNPEYHGKYRAED